MEKEQIISYVVHEIRNYLINNSGRDFHNHFFNDIPELLANEEPSYDNYIEGIKIKIKDVNKDVLKAGGWIMEPLEKDPCLIWINGMEPITIWNPEIIGNVCNNKFIQNKMYEYIHTNK